MKHEIRCTQCGHLTWAWSPTRTTCWSCQPPTREQREAILQAVNNGNVWRNYEQQVDAH